MAIKSKSYTQLYQRLPEELIKLLSAEYTQSDLDKLFGGFMENRAVTLRVNRLKTNVREVMEQFRRANIKFERTLWYEDALILRNVREKDLEEQELYQNGAVYLQSLSSMIPPLVLKPQPNDKVLDLTAAPGGKTTQMASMMQGNGFILANELNQIRAERMAFNIERQGAADIIRVRCGDGKRLDAEYENFFDKVLLDAPCSGVGCIEMAHPQTYRAWSLKQLSYLLKEQRKLLAKAFWALKPGGTLVYSTCSLLKEENWENVEQFIENNRDEVTLEDTDFILTGSEGVVRHNASQYSKHKMLTVLPSQLYEGFFIAKMRKKGKL